MLTPNEAYQYDPTFRRVVDLMCAYLSEYQITPSELRQAAILAATMHEDRRIRPLFISPAMFGGLVTNPPQTATGAMLDKSKCVCGYKGTNKELHSATCQHLNWEFYHPKTEHCHTFLNLAYRDYRVCADCGMSDVYYNWAYPSKK